MAAVVGKSIAKKIVGKAAGLVDPSQIALQAATTIQKKGQQESIELFGYDFVGLIIKLLIYFVGAFAIAKFMEAVILARGAFTIIAGLLGFNIPQSDEFPQQLRDLFGDGIHGVKYWDIIKVIAILLVVVEYLRYADINKKNGGKPSPMTTGVFLMIGLGLALTTIPELVQQIKNFRSMDFNREEFV